MLKKIIPLWTFCLALAVSSCGSGETVHKVYNEGINVTPRPLELTQSEGTYTLSKNAVFCTKDEALKTVANFFITKIKNSTGYALKVSDGEVATDYIKLSIVADLPVNDEGYLLEVTDKGIDIQAKTPQGAFYGMQTIMQLLPAEIESGTTVKNIAWNIPFVKVKDEPRFPYRGQHSDGCRHFVQFEDLKKQIDVLAMFKMNKFHWHLTDDQGWRLESKKYPKLNTISTTRVEGEGNEYGPFFYTQDQVRELVAYAKERFIEVIPEIELPGHAVAALAAYPEYSCTGGPFEVRNLVGISRDIFCAGNEKSFDFLTDIIEEAIPLFESDYFHIGGDEAHKARWEVCPKCQAKIKELGLKKDGAHTAEQKLQSYFVGRIEKVLLKNKKKMIGWDEILEGEGGVGLDKSSVIMSWRGVKGGLAAANMGHDVIMTPGKWLYLDHYQGDPKIAPSSTIGGYSTLDSVYSYDPIPAGIDEDKVHHILGAQVNNWTEYAFTQQILEWRMYPRLIALAEVTWTAKANRDYKDFERRIDNQLVRLDGHGLNYYIPQPEQTTPSCNFVAFTDTAKLAFKSTRPVKMVYTIDGTEPQLTSCEYKEPLTFTENTTLKIRSVLVSEKMGDVRTITIEKQTLAPAVEKPADLKLKVDYYKGLASKPTDLDGKQPDETEFLEAPQLTKYVIPNYREYSKDENYNTIINGYINIPEDGVYYLSSNAEEFWIDGKVLISNAGLTKRYSLMDKSIALKAGYHPIKIIRLCNIIGGWPPMWDKITVSMRADKDEKFRVLDIADFK